MKLYLAGPMTGRPQHNYPTFHAEAAALRELGYEVVNPAEHYTTPEGVRWEDAMRLALRALLDCDAIVLLPGWARSRGALLETDVARQLGMKLYEAGTLFQLEQ